MEEDLVWVDNEAAIKIAQRKDLAPKSRHFALRWHRVRDAAKQLVFCPTTLQRADAMTKLQLGKEQRDMLLHLHGVEDQVDESYEEEIYYAMWIF